MEAGEQWTIHLRTWLSGVRWPFALWDRRQDNVVHRGRALEYGAKPTIVNTSTSHPDVNTPLHSRPDPRVAVQSTSDIDTMRYLDRSYVLCDA